jgi:hypothetical protein
MKAYHIITGSSQSIADFEQKVGEALEMGYVLGSDLVAHPQGAALNFYQAMVLPEEDFEDDEEDEEGDEWIDDAEEDEV